MEDKKQKFEVYAVPKPTAYVIDDYEKFMKRCEEQKQDPDYTRMLENLERIKFNVEELKNNGGMKLELKRKDIDKK